MATYTDTTSLDDVVVVPIIVETSDLASIWAYTADTTTLPLFAPFLRETVATLNELRSLPANWDSYGADPVTEASIGVASKLLLSLQDRLLAAFGERIKPQAVVPLNDGGVQLEWEGNTREIEVEIAGDGTIGYLLAEQREDGRHFVEAYGVSLREAVDNIAYAIGSPSVLRLVA